MRRKTREMNRITPTPIHTMPQTTPNHNKNPSQKKNWTQNKFQRESRVGNQCKKGGGVGNEERKMGLKVGGYLLLHSEQSSFLYQKQIEVKSQVKV